MTVTDADKLACAKRELSMRRNTYPRWIEQRRMSSAKAALEIEVMEATVRDYQAVVELEATSGP